MVLPGDLHETSKVNANIYVFYLCSLYLKNSVSFYNVYLLYILHVIKSILNLRFLLSGGLLGQENTDPLV